MKRKSYARRMDRALFTGLLILFIIPLLLTQILKLFPQAQWTNKDWLRNRTLFREFIQPVPWSWKNFFSAKYQAGQTAQFDQNFAGREFIARLCNELYFRAFGQPASRERFSLGENGEIFGAGYLKEYFLDRSDPSDIEAWVTDLAIVQGACRQAHIPFALVITPSKVATNPENTPKEWQSRFDSRPRRYDQLVALLKKHGVSFVDGAELIKKNAGSKALAAPLFAKGGIHWGSTAALLTTNALLEMLRSQGFPAHPLTNRPFFTKDPFSLENLSAYEVQDTDGWNSLNLAIRWHYPVVRQAIQPAPLGSKKLTAVFVGGSFLTSPIYQLLDSGQFDEIYHYYYFAELRKYIAMNTESLTEPMAGLPDYAGDIFAADAVILEINEERISEQSHLTQFLKGALMNLPGIQSSKTPFSYKGIPRIDWNRPLSLSSASGIYMIPRGATTGFSGFQEPYTWTDSKTAKIVFILPENLGQKVVVRASVGAFLYGSLLQQKVEVYVNDQKMADWHFSVQDNVSERVIPLPLDLLNKKGDRCVTLRFEIERPMSPQELGMSPDPRKLGLRLLDLWLTPKID